MNVPKNQQMKLQLQLQLQPERPHSRTGLEVLADRTAQQVTGASAATETAESGGNASPPPFATVAETSAPSDRGGAKTTADPPSTPVATSPVPTSPLSLPSPYYDRNPVIGFPPHHHHHHHYIQHYGQKSPTVPLANVQNVVFAGDRYTNDSKHSYQRQQHHSHFNYKSSSLTNGRDDDKENVKQQNMECLQQQLDEVLKACVDYEERHKSRQSATVQNNNSGKTSPGTIAPTTTTPPYQNRIKTNGSLPRDTKKNGTPSPTALSPTSPLSPSSITWSMTTSPSLSTLSPLSPYGTGGDNDSVFLDNDNIPSSSSVTKASQNSAGSESPRPKMKTLVSSCPTTSTITTTTTTTSTVADLYCYGNKDQRLHHHRQFNGNINGFKISSGNPLISKSPEQLQQLSPSSLQSTSTWLRSSPFPADTTDGGNDRATTPVFIAAATERTTELSEQRRKLLVDLSAHKSRLVELHLRREEVDRELIIETALLRAELDAADDETRQSDNIVDGLDRAVAECRQQMDLCTVKQQEQRKAADSQLAGHRRSLQGLRNRLESIEDDDELKAEIRDSIDKQTELLEAEQKLYEDVEFGLLEEEAGWLARREELHRDRAAAVAVRRARRARAEWLRAQLDQLRSVGDDQLRTLRADINNATLSIQQGHRKLQDLDTANGTANTQDQYGRQQFKHDNAFTAEHQQSKSLEWSWDQQLKSSILPLSSSWDHQSKSPPWSPISNNSSGYMSPIMESVSNNQMTSSMTTTCCSSIASSGGEDDGCRLISEDSISRMSMSTIFDGGAAIKLRQKNKLSPDITKRPLTRYLPIRYDGDSSTENQIAFDLRAHIESAGHQLDDDNAVNNRGVDRPFWIDSSSCRGYLKKLSGTGGKNTRRSGRKWLKRWFVFDRKSRTLCYYRHRSDEDLNATNQGSATKKKNHPRASIRFQDIQEVYVDHTNSIKGQGCAFVVKTAQRTFCLSATTGQVVRVWVDVIFTGAEGYREYLKASTDNGCVDNVTTGNDVQPTKS